MTVDEFVETTKKELDIFAKAWNTASKVNPEAFPKDLPEGEFYESFLGESSEGIDEGLVARYMEIAKDPECQ